MLIRFSKLFQQNFPRITYKLKANLSFIRPIYNLNFYCIFFQIEVFPVIQSISDCWNKGPFKSAPASRWHRKCDGEIGIIKI